MKANTKKRKPKFRVGQVVAVYFKYIGLRLYGRLGEPARTDLWPNQARTR
jgi:hypothetical protein